MVPEASRDPDPGLPTSVWVPFSCKGGPGEGSRAHRGTAQAPRPSVLAEVEKSSWGCPWGHEGGQGPSAAANTLPPHVCQNLYWGPHLVLTTRRSLSVWPGGPGSSLPPCRGRALGRLLAVEVGNCQRGCPQSRGQSLGAFLRFPVCGHGPCPSWPGGSPGPGKSGCSHRCPDGRTPQSGSSQGQVSRRLGPRHQGDNGQTARNRRGPLLSLGGAVLLQLGPGRLWPGHSGRKPWTPLGHPTTGQQMSPCSPAPPKSHLPSSWRT